MAQPRQKKKQRSSRSKVKTGVSGRTKAGKKKVNFLGNETISQNWDRKLTLAQNYDRLGLSVRLNASTGGIEKKRHNGQDRLKIKPSSKIAQLVPREVQVERDPETGKIIRVIQSTTEQSARSNPLNDPLNDIMDTDDEQFGSSDSDDENPRHGNDIVAQLEAQAAQEMEEIEKKKKPRKQSIREEEWIEQLIEKYGDDTAAMFRDRKLNSMQQSEGDIKRRVKKWKTKHGG